MTNGYHPPREASEHPKRPAESVARRPDTHPSPTSVPKSHGAAQDTANDQGRVPEQA